LSKTEAQTQFILQVVKEQRKLFPNALIRTVVEGLAESDAANSVDP